MGFQYVIAVVPPESVSGLESQLGSLGISGITLTKVKGYGEYKNYFSNDPHSEYVRIEIFVEDEKIEKVVDIFGISGDQSGVVGGIFAAMPATFFRHLGKDTVGQIDPTP